MNKSELTFSAILVPLDYLAIFLAGLAAYALRFGTAITEIRPVIYELPYQEYLPIVLVAGFVWIIVFTLGGLYGIKATRKLSEEFSKIFLACSTAFLIIIIFIFFQRELFSSRFIIISGWLLSIIFVTVERFIVRSIQHYLLKKGIGAHHIIILGQGWTTDRIINEINNNPTFGYKIVNHFRIENEEDLERFKDSLKNSAISEVIQADPNIQKDLVLRIIDLCNENHLTFKYAANLFETSATNIEVRPLAGIPIIEIKKTPLDGWGKIFKRVFDLLFSIPILILLLPIFFAVGIIIKVDSPGPIFVDLERVGGKGKKFILYKFRSMIKGAHALKKDLAPYNERADGPLFKMRNDPRITRFGRFLRRTSIDEFPQFFNVVKGDISLVGPRPHEPEEVNHYQKHHKKLLTIKPGVTGMAQVSGRSDLSFEEEVRLDTYYIENWSLLLDLQLLLKTPRALLTKRSSP